MNKKKDVKIKRTFMRDEAYDILQEWIMLGKLEPGEKLRDQDLSNVLGISRTPIREALLRLEDDGLVVTKANRWTQVAAINLQEARDIYSIVEALEVLAAAQGFENVGETDISDLEAINETFEQKLKSGENIEVFQADQAFHDKIIQKSNNMELTRMLASLKVKIQRMEIHYFSKQMYSGESRLEHLKIIEAYKANKKEQVIQAIQENWRNSLARIEQIHDKNETN
ncbi:GntR family transcriptional regulator [Virgibacillus sp. W0430]|uniref:GntR family transcriptional regulator n=1 Tax=Virgibacillus sp. W0430 TaxID=3391580 RepID=UPI003F4566A4